MWHRSLIQRDMIPEASVACIGLPVVFLPSLATRSGERVSEKQARNCIRKVSAASGKDQVRTRGSVYFAAVHKRRLDEHGKTKNARHPQAG
jgi:hypothetical protein